MNFFKNKKSGFTLIEALVAVSILMIAIAAPMYLTQKSLSTASLAKDQMVASFLAQDAIEAVKNIRDEISLRGEGEDWLEDTLLQPCLCNDKDKNCNFNSDSGFIFCTIDTTVLDWENPDAIKTGKPLEKIKLTYNIDSLTKEKTFLKYDYELNPSCEGATEGKCSEDSKYTRYINILKNPAGNEDEALLKVRVSWDSPLGPQKVEIENFLYNFSENF